MARMLGRYRQGGCRPCTEPGPDCAGHERDTRRQKRAEQRAFRQEVNGVEPDDFYEDDEPIEKIKALFDALPKVLTARPVTAGGDPATNKHLTL